MTGPVYTSCAHDVYPTPVAWIRTVRRGRQPAPLKTETGCSRNFKIRSSFAMNIKLYCSNCSLRCTDEFHLIVTYITLRVVVMRTPFILKLRNSRCFTFAPLHVQQQIAYNYHKIKINNNIICANVVISRVTVYT